MTLLKKILTAPVFEDEAKTQQAFILHVIVWALICVPIPFVVYALFHSSEDITRTLLQTGFGETINILLLVMMRRGYIRAASIIQVSAFWFFFTATAMTGRGVQGEAYLLGYGLVIAIAGMLMGGRGALTFTFLSLAAGGYMVFQQIHGNLVPERDTSPISTWMISLVLFPIGAVLQYLATRTIRNALARARASEERYRLISQVSSDYTFSAVTDDSGNSSLSWVAGAFTEITGYTYEEYVATGGWVGHLHPDDVEKDDRDLEMIRQKKKVITEIRTFTKNREVRWVRVYGHPVWDNEKNQLKGIVGAVQDITEQKKAEEALREEENSERRRRDMLEKIVRIGKYVTEVQDVRVALQRIWHSIHFDLGIDRLGIYLYDPVTNTVHGSYGTNNQGEMVEEWNTRIELNDDRVETVSFKKVLEKTDGLYITHDYESEHNIATGHIMEGVKDYAAVAAWTGDKPVAVLCVDNVITNRPITDEDLEALRLFAGYAGLAIENARLHSALETELEKKQGLINELETQNAELERFTYTVSHDLKSPLVTITGFLGFLETDAEAGDKEKVKSSISRITGAAKKMQKLLNDLLELSRIGRLMNPPEDIPFDEIVYEAIDQVRGHLDEVDAVVVVQRDLPNVLGDRIRLVEVVQNLVENAVKYSAPGTKPHIEIGVNGINEKGYPVFFVRDNGIGIDPQYHERIFGLFNKLDAQSEGTGIGLSLVKRIIEVHNGQIWVESTKGRGSTFHFFLPTTQTKE